MRCGQKKKKRIFKETSLFLGFVTENKQAKKDTWQTLPGQVRKAFAGGDGSDRQPRGYTETTSLRRCSCQNANPTSHPVRGHVCKVKLRASPREGPVLFTNARVVNSPSTALKMLSSVSLRTKKGRPPSPDEERRRGPLTHGTVPPCVGPGKGTTEGGVRTVG